MPVRSNRHVYLSSGDDNLLEPVGVSLLSAVKTWQKERLVDDEQNGRRRRDP